MINELSDHNFEPEVLSVASLIVSTNKKKIVCEIIYLRHFGSKTNVVDSIINDLKSKRFLDLHHCIIFFIDASFAPAKLGAALLCFDFL